MRREKGRRASVCCAVAVILMCHLVQGIDCYRLTKTERRGGRKEADALGARKGKVVFGKSVGKGSGLESEVKYGKASTNSSVEESYQADFIGKLQVHSLCKDTGCRKSVLIWRCTCIFI